MPRVSGNGGADVLDGAGLDVNPGAEELPELWGDGGREIEERGALTESCATEETLLLLLSASSLCSIHRSPALPKLDPR